MCETNTSLIKASNTGGWLSWPGNPPMHWRAKWIAPVGAENRKNYFFYARKKMFCEKIPCKTQLSIAAESAYLLYVNGEFVGQGPARGTRTRNYFDCYDVHSLLRAGENLVAVLVACGNKPTFIAAPAQPALLLQLDEIIATDNSWEVLPATEWAEMVPTYTPQIGFIEHRDLRLEPVGWQTGADGRSWEQAREICGAHALAGKELLPRDLPALRCEQHALTTAPSIFACPAGCEEDVFKISTVISTEEHVSIIAGSQDVAGEISAGQPIVFNPAPDGAGVGLIFDFGREIVGSFRLDVDAPAGAVCDVAYDECLIDGRIITKRKAYDSYTFTDRYLTRFGRQNIGAIVHPRGFRYVQCVFRNFTAPIAIHGVKAVDRRLRFAQRADFNCDDPVLNQIWQVCRETISACATDVFMDCPWREMAFWLNDFLVVNLTALQMFGDPTLHRRSFHLAFSQCTDENLLPGVCPTTGNDHLVLVSANLFMPLILSDYLLYTGDLETVESVLPGVLRILATLKTWENTDGLLIPPAKYWNFLDWSYNEFSGGNDELKGRNSAPVNWFYVMALDAAAGLLNAAGRVKDAEALVADAARVAAGINRRFWVSRKSRYAEWLDGDRPCAYSSQLTHATALLSARSGSARRKQIAEAIDNQSFLSPELFMQHFVLRALAETGKCDGALERIRKYWGAIVSTGSPTIWEYGVHQKGKAACRGAGSLCHAFSSAPVNFLQTVVLGIKPLAPGFAEFSVAPNSCGLRFAGGRVPTPHGDIVVEWIANKQGNRMAVILEVPQNTQARTRDGRRMGPGRYEFSLTSCFI